MAKEDNKDEFELEIEDVEQSKRHIVLYIFLGIIVLFCFILLYSRYIATSIIKIDEHPIYTDKIYDEADGFKIVHFSDLLYGSTISDKKLAKIVDDINLLKPDVVLFTGGLISSDYKLNNDSIDNIIKNMKNIDSKYGKYAIRGDEDFKNDTFIEIMEQSDFKYLDNSYDFIYLSNNKYIFIGGITSSLKSHDNYDLIKTFNDESIYKIILMHEPDNIDNVLKNIKPDLALAGHSLLGQFRLPFIGGISYDDGSKKYTNNYYNLSGTEFYISSGIGTKDYPFRFLNNPKINFYRIIKNT